MPHSRIASNLARTAACAAALAVAAAAPSTVGLARSDRAGADETGCRPTQRHQPVCPRGATDEATFVDPTVEVQEADAIRLGRLVYIGPFARLMADDEAGITIDEESNVQDNVSIIAAYERDDVAEERVEQLFGNEKGVEIAERVILAHGATVKGPAKIGIGGGDIVVDPDADQEVFLSFGTEVDGAILQRNTGISALGRVGPGVTLKSGFIVLPGKNVTTQAQADDPALGKVRLLTEADVAFNEAVIEVNVAFAREYTRLFKDNPASVRGINFDPGHTSFNHDRDLPSFAGIERRVPGFRNRVIGDIDFADSLATVNAVMGSRISIRADEGEPFEIGQIARMASNVIFHALEETPIVTGDGVRYGNRAIVHGGGRDPIAGGGNNQETIIGSRVILAARSVVFRSRIGDGSRVGFKSAVVASSLPPNTVIPDRQVFVNNELFGHVEW
jgi:carbonic anhydrase/acetyltransferase-like protein (isoleucine patch superfamily)